MHEPNQSSEWRSSAAYNGQDACQAPGRREANIPAANDRKNRSAAKPVPPSTRSRAAMPQARRDRHKTALRWTKNYGLRSEISSFQ
jgi:hypothetical protein